MRRIRYILRDNLGLMKAMVLTPEGQEPEVEPWMAENLRSSGWTIERFPDPIESVIDVHGYADWKAVAEMLADALRPLLADEHSVDTEDEAEDFLDKAQQAMDAYDVAQMEVAMVSVSVAEPQPSPSEEEDGSDDS